MVLIKILLSQQIANNKIENTSINKTINIITKLVKAWKEENVIDTVLDFEGYTVEPEEINIRFWLSPPRIISNKSKNAQIFFEVFTPNNIRALAIY